MGGVLTRNQVQPFLVNDSSVRMEKLYCMEEKSWRTVCSWRSVRTTPCRVSETTSRTRLVKKPDCPGDSVYRSYKSRPSCKHWFRHHHFLDNCCHGSWKKISFTATFNCIPAVSTWDCHSWPWPLQGSALARESTAAAVTAKRQSSDWSVRWWLLCWSEMLSLASPCPAEIKLFQYYSKWRLECCVGITLYSPPPVEYLRAIE